MIKFNKEQIYIVTGASSGLGEATALLLNELGATVVAIARNEQRLNDMKAKCKFPENMFLEIKDLAEDIAGLPQYVKELKNKYGKFSGMAYCAGITQVVPIRALEYEQMRDVFKIDYEAPIFMTKGLVDKRNNVGEGTSIVLVSSMAGVSASRGMVSYCGAKAALINSAVSVAKENAPVRVNCVSPADIETPMTQTGEIKGFVDARKDHYLLGLGKSEDVANTIVFLLSDKAKWINTQNYYVDCGSI